MVVITNITYSSMIQWYIQGCTCYAARIKSAVFFSPCPPRALHCLALPSLLPIHSFSLALPLLFLSKALTSCMGLETARGKHFMTIKCSPNAFLHPSLDHRVPLLGSIIQSSCVTSCCETVAYFLSSPASL